SRESLRKSASIRSGLPGSSKRTYSRGGVGAGGGTCPSKKAATMSELQRISYPGFKGNSHYRRGTKRCRYRFVDSQARRPGGCDDETYSLRTRRSLSAAPARR